MLRGFYHIPFYHAQGLDSTNEIICTFDPLLLFIVVLVSERHVYTTIYIYERACDPPGMSKIYAPQI